MSKFIFTWHCYSSKSTDHLVDTDTPQILIVKYQSVTILMIYYYFMNLQKVYPSILYKYEYTRLNIPSKFRFIGIKYTLRTHCSTSTSLFPMETLNAIFDSSNLIQYWIGKNVKNYQKIEQDSGFFSSSVCCFHIPFFHSDFWLKKRKKPTLSTSCHRMYVYRWCILLCVNVCA